MLFPLPLRIGVHVEMKHSYIINHLLKRSIILISPSWNTWYITHFSPYSMTLPNATLRTCKRCKELFNPNDNKPNACAFHPEWFAGIVYDCRGHTLLSSARPSTSTSSSMNFIIYPPPVFDDV